MTLLHSRKFWLAILDAFFGSMVLVIGVASSPATLDALIKVYALWQPVILTVIYAVTQEDVATIKAGTASSTLTMSSISAAVTPSVSEDSASANTK